MLTTANHEFLSQPALRIPLEIDVVFRLYFGDPNATIASKLLSFLPGTPPYPWDAVVSRSAVVHAVLSRVWRGLMTTEKANIVRLYYGGSEITPNVEAYTNQKVRDGRINVHLGTDFFDKHGEPVMKNQMSSSRSAVLVHEYTHALAGTKDFPGAYSPASCRKMASTDDRYGLPCRSLLSAQSYASFVEDAFA